MNRSLPIEKALEDAIVAYKMNGEALRPEQGYPVPRRAGWEGNLWSGVAPPHRGRRPAAVHARGDVEIYRPPADGRRAAYLLHGREIRRHRSGSRVPLHAKGRNVPRASRGRGAGGSRVSM